MSGAAASTNPSTTKALASDPPSGTPLKDEQKPAAALEEDDEFEDFPVDGARYFHLYPPSHSPPFASSPSSARPTRQLAMVRTNC